MAAPSSSPEGGRCEILVTEAAADSSRALDLEGLTAWLDDLLAADFAASGPVTVQLQSAAENAELNRRYRRRRQATDVLSFPGGESAVPHLGDIAIALPVARRQAEEEGHSLQTEVQMLILHGLLHCLGYDHETDDGEMVDRELALRQRWLANEKDEGLR